MGHGVVVHRTGIVSLLLQKGAVTQLDLVIALEFGIDPLQDPFRLIQEIFPDQQGNVIPHKAKGVRGQDKEAAVQP